MSAAPARATVNRPSGSEQNGAATRSRDVMGSEGRESARKLNDIENAGRANAPRIARKDVPIKPGRDAA